MSILWTVEREHRPKLYFYMALLRFNFIDFDVIGIFNILVEIYAHIPIMHQVKFAKLFKCPFLQEKDLKR